MKNQINVLGYTGNNSQFVVKTLNANLRFNQNEKYPELEGPNPYEYILAGFAGCINALGQEVAAEQGIALRSLQIEITGSMETHEAGTRKPRPGFKNIEITLKPAATAPLEALQAWMKEVQFRSPVYDTLVNNTPVNLSLYKEYTYNYN
ncbi:osmotically inducible protein C [Flavobacterium album]|uniref:Osmotically inducible protein C n=1 Tax=Flavobacterium album TaxID=2175091 RepID=A0A2S1QXN7_9FLAO|nr:OsmC family protein [Flavobacterium album]AWH85001.1 osmotically inducible protein C [Flavobacterium album]